MDTLDLKSNLTFSLWESSAFTFSLLFLIAGPAMSSWSIPHCIACVGLQVVFWLRTPAMRDGAGWPGFVWQTWWSLDAVTRPARIRNHKRVTSLVLRYASLPVYTACLWWTELNHKLLTLIQHHWTVSHYITFIQQVCKNWGKATRFVNIFVTITSDHRQNGRFDTRVLLLYGIKKSVQFFWRSGINAWQVFWGCFCWWCTAVLKWCIQLMLSACGWCKVNDSTTRICHHLERGLSQYGVTSVTVFLSLILLAVSMVKSTAATWLQLSPKPATQVQWAEITLSSGSAIIHS